MTTAVDTWRDSMRVPIEIGDRVMVVALGYGATREDIRTEWIVEGFARTRVKVTPTLPSRGRTAFGTAVISVLRRDGGDGFEGNRLAAEALAAERSTITMPSGRVLTVDVPKAPIMVEHMEEARQLVNAYSSTGAFLDDLVRWIAQAIANAEVRAAAHRVPLTGEQKAAAERVRAFLAARETMPGMDPKDITGIGGQHGIEYLTVADLATLAGLA